MENHFFLLHITSGVNIFFFWFIFFKHDIYKKMIFYFYSILHYLPLSKFNLKKLSLSQVSKIWHNILTVMKYLIKFNTKWLKGINYLQQEYYGISQEYYYSQQNIHLNLKKYIFLLIYILYNIYILSYHYKRILRTITENGWHWLEFFIWRVLYVPELALPVSWLF